MTPEACLIASTEVDWTKFLQEADNIIARSPTKSLDKQGTGAFGLAAFLACIGECQKPNTDPVKALRYNSDLLRHVALSFLIHTTKDSIFEIMQVTTLAISGIVATGNLAQWQSAVITCCSENTLFETRLLFDKIYILIDRIGLGEVWSLHNKRKLTDGTFIMEPK